MLRRCRPVMFSQYRDSLRAGRSGDKIPVGERYSAPIQTGHGVHTASSTMGTVSFSSMFKKQNSYKSTSPYGLYRASEPLQGGTGCFPR
jgi:hypothetical protein